jgi:hypothetical protein
MAADFGTYLKKLPVHSALCHSVCRAPSDTVQCSTAVDTHISFTHTALVTAASSVLASHVHILPSGSQQCADTASRVPARCWLLATDVTRPYTDPAVTLVLCPTVNVTDVARPYTDRAVTLVLCPTVHACTIQMQSQRSFPKPYVKYFPDDGRTGVDTCRK